MLVEEIHVSELEGLQAVQCYTDNTVLLYEFLRFPFGTTLLFDKFFR